MTEIKPREQKKSRAGRLSLSESLFCITSAMAVLLTLWRSELTSAAMLGAMKSCVSAVIPSLFPFMVLCDIFVSSGAADIMARIFGSPFEKLFGIGREGSTAVLLGLVFGFPVGTKSALSLYESGRIGKSETEHLLCFCNGPSSAFLISAVGGALFGSRSFGVVLCVSEMLSAVVIGVAARAFFRADRSKNNQKISYLSQKERRGGVLSVVDAVTSSAAAMLSVCAFIVFFSAISAMVDEGARAMGAGQTARALLTSFLELTGGVRAIAGAEIERYASCILCAAAVGWSGISVHFQFISLLKDSGLSYRPYFVAKAARAVLDICFVGATLWCFGDRIEFGESTASSFLHVGELHPIYLVSLIAVLLAGLFKLRAERGKLKDIS